MQLIKTIKQILHINPPGDTRPWVKCVKCQEYVMWGNKCSYCGMQN